MDGRRGRPAARVVLSEKDRTSLEAVVRRRTAPQRNVQRARIALLASEGVPTPEIAERVGVSVVTASKWRNRFARAGLEGLADAERSGRPRRIDETTRLQIISLACEPNKSEEGRCTPTLDEILAKAKEREVVDQISRSHLHRILQSGDVHPHRVRMWLHSPDPEFRSKVNEICALYHNPPEGSVVLCVDEKTGMQATERKYTGRGPGPGRVRRHEFEYVRHGTQTLIGAFEVQSGEVTGSCGDTRTGDDLEAFMEDLARKYPNQEVHIVWDNLNTHCAREKRWNPFNQRHGGRFYFHYTPIHASWVNQIELWFGILGRRCLRNASFSTVAALRRAVLDFIMAWDRAAAKPFRWTFQGYPLQTGTDSS